MPKLSYFGTGVAQTEVEVDGEAARQIKPVAHGQSGVPQLALIAGVFQEDAAKRVLIYIVARFRFSMPLHRSARAAGTHHTFR